MPMFTEADAAVCILVVESQNRASNLLIKQRASVSLKTHVTDPQTGLVQAGFREINLLSTFLSWIMDVSA